MVGEYSVRGGILDVFSPESPKPVRMDLFGDQVESIRRFDVESQRSVMKVEDCTLLPLTEYQRSRELLVELGGTDARGGHPRDATCPRPASRFRAGNWWPPWSGRVHASVFALPGTPRGGMGRAGPGCRRRRSPVEAPGTDRNPRRLTIPERSFSAGKSCNGRLALSPRSR